MKKSLVYPFLILLLSFLLGACSEQTQEATISQNEDVTDTKEEVKGEGEGEEVEATEANVTPTPQWSYEEETGPEHWGELDPSYSVCIKGNEQSPINIETSQVKTSEKLEGLDIQYKPTDFSIVHNGHAIQANPATSNNSIAVEGKEYKLAQFHFHTPSEHQFNGENLDMELHLVHQDGNGELAVLGVMIQEGKENEALASIWGALPKSETAEEVAIEEPVDLQALLPADETSYFYEGSLTTPPCSEEVQWIVFENPIEMSKEQIQSYQEIFPDNQRPVQGLNEREIIKE